MTKNLCRSMVESSQTTVTHLMDKAWLKVQSGAFTYQDAIYDAVSELAEQGIAAVTYSSGKTDWADVAVRRAVMTGISQTAGQMQLDLAAEMDCDLVEVTAHMGARPSHALWQGKVYSISGKSKNTLSSVLPQATELVAAKAGTAGMIFIRFSRVYQRELISLLT